MEKFIKFLDELPHKYKIVIAGNHELTLDSERYEKILKPKFEAELQTEKDLDISELKKKLSDHCIYLENSGTDVYGYHVYGSPYSLEYYGWAFMKEEKDLPSVWDMIPEEADIVLTHGPPFKIFDYDVLEKKYDGSKSLRRTILKRVKPLYHIFGHVHEGYGVKKIDETTFINASYLDENYKAFNKPIVFELPVREGKKRGGKTGKSIKKKPIKKTSRKVSLPKATKRGAPKKNYVRSL